MEMYRINGIVPGCKIKALAGDTIEVMECIAIRTLDNGKKYVIATANNINYEIPIEECKLHEVIAYKARYSMKGEKL